MTSLYEQLQEAVRAIRARVPEARPQVGLILGSGLSDFVDALADAVAIPYAELPYFKSSSVAGHPGRLVLGRMESCRIAALQGRVHLYEGHSARDVAFPARVLCALGVGALVVTNAAGGIHPSFTPGDLMVITDHLNLSGENPLTGWNDERLGVRFPDMTAAYDPVMTARLFEAAMAAGVSLQRGTYAMLRGPTYETPAEIRMLRVLGADAVGMSTVPEVIAAVHMGVRVAGISCISNLAAGMSPQPLSHEEVARTARQVMGTFSGLLRAYLPTLVPT